MFGVNCRKGIRSNQICFATILMKDALKKFVKSGDKVLDIGTGSFAIHSIWLKKNTNADITATEIDDKVIESAKMVMKDNKVKFKIEKRDLFKGLKTKFDLAIINPPFEDKKDILGYKFVRRLLKECPKNLRIMISVNSMYVDLRKIANIIKENNFEVISIVKKTLIPARVYVVQRIS